MSGAAPAAEERKRVRAMLGARADVVRLLGAVERLGLPDGRIGAGPIRGAGRAVREKGWLRRWPGLTLA